MSESTIRGLIYTIVNGVTDIGKVYDYHRYSNELDAFLNFYQTTIGGQVQVRGWTVGFEGFGSEQSDTCDAIREYTFKVRGYLGLIDSLATEKTGAVLAEAVANALDDATSIRTAVYPFTKPASIDVYEHRLFGGESGVLCHYAEITQRVTELRSI